MLPSVIPVRSLLLAIFMLMAGGGFMTSFIGLQLEAAGHRAPTIGLVTTAYFVGLTIGSLRVTRLIERVGHIRTFSAVVSLLSASTLAYSLAQNAAWWTLLRLVDGLCVASVYVCLESWLNERAEPATRGSILAAYMIALYAGQAVGQHLLNLGGAPMLPFVIAAVLISLAVLPVALTRMTSPAPGEQAPLSIPRLYAASPLGFVGVGVTGLMLGAFYALGAVYAQRLGMTLSATALFMSVVISGGVALQWPLGWLSDRYDRRSVIVGALLGAVAVGVLLAATSASGAPLMVLGGLFGGLAFALYPLCVAHTNDHLSAAERVGASGGLVLVYSVGAAVGPMAGSVAMLLLGPAGLFVWIGTCAAAGLGFALWRQRRRGPVPGEQQQPYQILPRTSPMAAQLDPLARPGEKREAELK
jgi:MFS family permease